MTNAQPPPHRRFTGSFCRGAVEDRGNRSAGVLPAETPNRVKFRQLVNLHKQTTDGEAGVQRRQTEVQGDRSQHRLFQRLKFNNIIRQVRTEQEV